MTERAAECCRVCSVGSVSVADTWSTPGLRALFYTPVASGHQSWGDEDAFHNGKRRLAQLLESIERYLLSNLGR